MYPPAEIAAESRNSLSVGVPRLLADAGGTMAAVACRGFDDGDIFLLFRLFLNQKP